MLIAIMSDSHDNLDNLRKALKVIEERNCQVIIHAGDFVSPFTWRVLGQFKGEIYGVFGNNDGDRVMLKKFYEDRIKVQPIEVKVENTRIAVMHEPAFIEELAKSNSFDIIVYGHTHQLDNKKISNTLVINPGELCGWLYNDPTFMILDTSKLNVEIIHLKEIL
jgi:uncharacterized protein